MISSARYPTARVTWSKPAAASWRRTMSRIGRSPIGTSGFGKTVVYGASLVPLPPARTIAFIPTFASLVVEHVCQRLFDRDPGFPAGQPAETRRVADLGRDVVGLESCGIELGCEWSRGEPDQRAQAVIERHRPAGAYVVDGSRSSPLCEEQVGAHDIPYVGVVAHRHEVAGANRPRTRLVFAICDGGREGARRQVTREPGSQEVERPCANDPKALGRRVATCHLLGGELACAVGRDRMRPPALADRATGRPSVDGARAHEHDDR